MTPILIASDHAGFELKALLVPFLRELGHEVIDFGALEMNADDDYPDFIAPLAKEISESGGTKQGIVIGGSGQGEAMVANRFPHVRAIVFAGQPADANGVHAVKIAREHNDANVLSLGARFMSETDAKSAVKTFLTTEFSGEERHVRRLKKVDDIKPA